MLSASASALAIMAAGQALGQDVDTVDEVVVTGIRASIQQSIETKRNANAVVDVLSAEDVGKFPDKNLAEALQRVPGVTINREFGEGERVSLRGLAPNLTRTLYNGHGLATADWFILDQQSATRSFNFLMLPSEIIGQTVVYKSPTADLEEGGVGGTVNVITRKPLDLEPLTVYASAQGAYTEMSDKWDPQFSGLVSWKNADETLGVLVAGVYQKRQIRRDAIEVLGYSNYTLNGQSLLVPALIGSALFQQERVRQGANFEVQWKPNDRVELALSGLYSKFDADNFNQNYMAWGSNALGSAGGTLTNATIQDDTVVAGTITSGPGGRAVVFDAIDRSALAETRNINFEAKLNPTEDWALRFQVGYTDASGDTESQPFAEFAQPGSFTYDLRGGLPKVSYGGGINPASPAGMIFDFASLHQITNDDSEFYAYADAERQLELGALSAVKFGVKYTDHERETDFQATTYGGFFMPLEASGCGGRCTAANFAGGPLPSDFAEDFAQPGALTSYWQVDRDKLQSIFYGLPASVRARVPNYPEIFSVQEKAFAGYVMGEFEGEGWRGNIGVRVINTEQTSTGYGTSLAATDPGRVSNAFGDFRLISVTREYTDVLPSANFTFDLTDDLILRFAAARVMGRPDFTDIAPRVSLNPGALSGAGGDPNIDPYRANQFDVSFEWYPRPQTMVAAALYLKDLQSFITDRPVTQTFGIETQTPNASLCTPAGGANPNLFNCQFTINRRANGGGGKLQGVELSVQAPIWNGFGVLGSYTYSDAELDSGEPLPGNSTHAFNLTAFYENDRLSARLAYAQRSEFFVTFDRATQLNQDGLKQLDASVVFNVTDQLALTFDAQNLTDEEIVQYAGDSFRPRGTYDYGRTYFVGARFRY
jgi:iron complex outermembrane receptor protein